MIIETHLSRYQRPRPQHRCREIGAQFPCPQQVEQHRQNGHRITHGLGSGQQLLASGEHLAQRCGAVDLPAVRMPIARQLPQVRREDGIQLANTAVGPAHRGAGLFCHRECLRVGRLDPVVGPDVDDDRAAPSAAARPVRVDARVDWPTSAARTVARTPT